jgi:membrane-associated phospholipid phosphatase
VHYPSDVAGGLVLGATIGATVVLAFRPATAALAARLARTPLRPLIAGR